MAAISTLIAAGSLALGATGAAAQYNKQKQTERAARNNAEQAEIEAREAAKLKGMDTPDARVQVGATDANASSTISTDEKGRSKRKKKSDAYGKSLTPTASNI